MDNDIWIWCFRQKKLQFISDLTLETDRIYSWIAMAEMSIESRSWIRCYCLLLARQDDVLKTYPISWLYWSASHVNILRPRQNYRRFADIFKCIFLNEIGWISLTISLKFVPDFRFHNVPTLVQIVASHRSGVKPASEPMMVDLHVCVTRPQWVNMMNQMHKKSNKMTHKITH